MMPDNNDILIAQNVGKIVHYRHLIEMLNVYAGHARFQSDTIALATKILLAYVCSRPDKFNAYMSAAMTVLKSKPEMTHKPGAMTVIAACWLATKFHTARIGIGAINKATRKLTTEWNIDVDNVYRIEISMLGALHDNIAMITAFDYADFFVWLFADRANMPELRHSMQTGDVASTITVLRAVVNYLCELVNCDVTCAMASPSMLALAIVSIAWHLLRLPLLADGANVVHTVAFFVMRRVAQVVMMHEHEALADDANKDCWLKDFVNINVDTVCRLAEVVHSVWFAQDPNLQFMSNQKFKLPGFASVAEMRLRGIKLSKFSQVEPRDDDIEDDEDDIPHRASYPYLLPNPYKGQSWLVNPVTFEELSFDIQGSKLIISRRNCSMDAAAEEQQEMQLRRRSMVDTAVVS